MAGAALMSEPKPSSKRTDLAVKIDAEIARQAKTMCSYRGKTITDYLSAILRPIVARDFEKFREELGKKRD